MQSSVHAPILQRKHSTAHYFQNGTVYILGGIDLNATTTTRSFGPSIITLRFNKKDFSLHSYADNSLAADYPTIVGQTSHVHNLSNTIISVLGIPLLQDRIPPLLAIPSMKSPNSISQNITYSPKPRYFHTSVVLNDTLHVVGGRDVETHRPVDDTIWSYSLSTRLWTQSQTNIPRMSGHITIVYYQWLISCFGGDQSGFLTSRCTWFDTVSRNVTQIADNSHVVEWPTARKYASMISHSNKFILFGGETKSAILDDIWYLNIQAPFKMNWTRINTLTSYKRSAHASALIDDDVILYYGGQESSTSLATDPIYFNITNKEWLHAKITQTEFGVDLDNTSGQQSQDSKISGGAIAGILMGVICVLALGVAYFVWRKKLQRRKKLNDGRAARFSQAPPPLPPLPPPQLHVEKPADRSSGIHYPLYYLSNKLPGTGLKEGGPNFVSLPELALHNNNNRISTLSLGTEFNFSTDEYRHSHHSTASSAVESHHTIPKIELNTSPDNNTKQQLTMEPLTEGKSVNYKRRESTGFNRLTLNLFSNNNNTNTPQPDTKKNRSSSLFQLRSSRLLQPTTPTTPNMTDNRSPLMQSRLSLSAKSVSSVQWVGFNDNMDGWRDSTGSSLHLAVTNAQRSSMYYSDSSAQSTPRSPMFPQYLKDAAIQHQMFGQDNSSKSLSETNKGSTTTLDSSRT